MRSIRSAAIALAAAALALAGCGGGTPANITVHGQVEPGGGALASAGGGGLEMNYSGCASDQPTPGTQITVVDASSKVIGNSTLATWSHKTATSGGLTMYPCWEPFTIKVPSGESRYGFQIAGVPGTIWTTNVRQPGGVLSGGLHHQWLTPDGFTP